MADVPFLLPVFLVLDVTPIPFGPDVGPVELEGIDSDHFQICTAMWTDKLLSQSAMGTESDLPITIRAECTCRHACSFLYLLVSRITLTSPLPVNAVFAEKCSALRTGTPGQVY
jgi:hypothetical protein